MPSQVAFRAGFLACSSWVPLGDEQRVGYRRKKGPQTQTGGRTHPTSRLLGSVNFRGSRIDPQPGGEALLAPNYTPAGVLKSDFGLSQSDSHFMQVCRLVEIIKSFTSRPPDNVDRLTLRRAAHGLAELSKTGMLLEFDQMGPWRAAQVALRSLCLVPASGCLQ